MNSIEKRMLELLKEMRDEDRVVAVKAEFEAEGSRMDELVMLNEVVFRADMNIVIKIGGCEAVSDMERCKMIGAYGVMAPMIETPFAMTKFKKAAQRVYGAEISRIEWIINAETKTCHQNLDEILEEGKGFLKTVTIGRDDLSSSMNIPKSEINGEEMFATSRDILERSRRAGFTANIGGNMSNFDSIPFIERIKPYTDRIETRKVIIDMNTERDERALKKCVADAIEFEALYLQNKCDYYGSIAKEDENRLAMMKARLETARAQL